MWHFGDDITVMGAPRFAFSYHDGDARLTSSGTDHRRLASMSEFRRIIPSTTMESSRMLFISEASLMLRLSEGQLRVTQREKIAVITEDT
jgi:hypothetical protein